MVCKNCGADLKPGIKYCLECGSYIDEEDEDIEVLSDEEGNSEISTDYTPIELGEEVKKKRKRKKLNLTLTDYLIYAGLLIVMIGSIIVIIVSLAKSNSQTTTETTTPIVETVEADKKVSIDEYNVVVPGKLTSTVQESTLYVSDNVNFTFSYQNSEDDFDAYLTDHNRIEKKMSSSKYEIVSSNEKTINERVFLLYELKVNGSTKRLYMTKVNSKYLVMGVIEVLPSGNWEEALPVIDTIVNSMNFQFE